MRASADLHVFDFDFGEILPVPGVAAISVPPRKPKDPDLLALPVPHDLCGLFRARYTRRAGLDVFAIAGDEDLIEGDRIARLRIEERDSDRNARLGAEF